MREESKLFLKLLMIIIILFPSICLSELKTVRGEYCYIHLCERGDKICIEEARAYTRVLSILNGLNRISTNGSFNEECVDYIARQYVENIKVLSHSERGRRMCDKVQITADQEIINKYHISMYERCAAKKMEFELAYWWDDVADKLQKKVDKHVTIGLIIDTKMRYLDVIEKMKLEDKEEENFYNALSKFGGKVKVADRRHLSKVLEEQKLSLSGLTDENTVKLGKMLNIDIIVIRMIYDKKSTTKMIKVDTGEVLMIRTEVE